MQVIAAQVDRCTGCRTCELYCATERGSDSKTLLAAIQEVPVPQPRLRVEGNNRASLPLQCRHCADAPCLNACLTGALVRHEGTGMVVVNEDRCIGCWTCTMFCPYGVIFPWSGRKVALKCDRCAFMEEPVCVDVCPTRALALVEVDDIEKLYRSKRRNAWRQVAAAAPDEAAVLSLAE